MLILKSDINLIHRFDAKADAWTLASGVTGTFVEIANTESGDGLTKPTAGNFAVAIWSESNRDGSPGWSPDIAATGNLTYLYGKYRAVTDQIESGDNPIPGTPLYVSANGKLTTTSTGNKVVVAICTKAKHTCKYLSTPYQNCIEFVTI